MNPYMFTMTGEWIEIDHDPVLDAPGVSRGDGADFTKQVRQAGYCSFTGYPSHDLAPLRLDVSRAGREALERGEPTYLVAIDTPESYDVVYAENTPALMDLLSRWAPAVQSAVIADFTTGLESPGTTDSELGLLLHKALDR